LSQWRIVVAAVSELSVPVRASQPVRTGLRRHTELPMWPLWMFFAGFPVMWVLGLGGFVNQIAAIPMFAYLAVVRPIRLPRGFGVWLLFLIWMTVTVVEVHGGSRIVGFIYRATLYYGATVAFVYVYNCSPRRLTLARLCTMASVFLGFVVLGGYLGIVAPHHVLSTPFGKILPAHFVHNDLVNKLVKPPFAQVSNSTYFHLAPRPAAPFPYTNDWGVNFALLVPFVLALLAVTKRPRVRIAMIGLLTLGLIPALLTLNRGMLLGLGVGLAYAAVRFAFRGNARGLLVLGIALAIGVTLMSTLHFQSRLHSRETQSQSTDTRASVYRATYDEVKQSPVLGYGAPSTSTVSTTGPDLGSQGQFWMVLYSAGFPGALLFVVSLFEFAWRTRKPATGPMLWMHVVPVIAISVLLFYRMQATELVLVMVATAIAMRDRPITRKTPAIRYRPRRRRTYHRVSTAAKRSVRQTSSAAQASTGVSGVLTFAGGIIAAAGGLLLTLVVARGLGPTRTGVFFVSIGLFTILSNTLELGADTGLVRMVPRQLTLGRTRELPRVLLSAVIPVAIAGTAAAVLVAVFAPTLARVFMSQGSLVLGSSFLRSIAPYLAVAPLATVLIAGTRGFGSVVPFVTIQNIAVPLIRPLAIGALIAAGIATNHSVAHAWGIPWVLAAVAAAIVISTQLHSVMHRDQDHEKPRSYRAVSREFWAFASARAFAGTAEITLVWLDVLLVGWLVGPRQAGIYATASRFVTTGALALQASRIAISPRLAHLMAAGQTKAAERLYNGSAQAVIAVSWPLYIGFACFSALILRLFGHGFTDGATALTILAVAMLVDMATGNITTVLLMSGGSRWNLLNAGTGLTIDVLLDLLLIPHLGATGAAIGWGASIVTINLMACLEVRFALRMQVFDRANVRTMLANALCFGVPGVILAIFAGQSLWALLAWAIIGVATYGAWWWHRRNEGEVQAVLRAVRSRTRGPAVARGLAG
jgi:O-antigen/teichoic acid export membrane protein